jgi:type I restriction enzyme S subunit
MNKSSLPKGWPLVKVGDVVDNMNETTRDPESIGLGRVVGLDHMDPESLLLKRWDDLSDLHEGTSFTRVFRSGQVLFGKRRAYQKKVSVPDFDGICSGDILVFQPKNDELLPEFLPYLVQSDGFFDHALGTSAGSLSPRTKWQELAKYEFALPPIAEQHRIIKAMNALETTRDSYSEIETATLRTSIVLATSSANLVVREKVDSLCENVRDSSLGRELHKDQFVVGLEHMISGEVFQKRYGDKTAVSGAVTKFAKGDVLYGKLRPNLRKVSIATFDGYCTTEILALRPRKVYSCEVLHAILSSKFVLNEVLKHSKGTKMPRVNPGDLMSIEVPKLNAEQIRNASAQLNALNLIEEKRADSYDRLLDVMRAIRESLLQGVSQGNGPVDV